MLIRLQDDTQTNSSANQVTHILVNRVSHAKKKTVLKIEEICEKVFFYQLRSKEKSFTKIVYWSAY
jgi:hypothetical protein